MVLSDIIGELKSFIQQLLDKISGLELTISRQKAENVFARARLDMGSSNNTKSSLSDGLHHKPAFTRKRGGFPGGQQGLEGLAIEMSRIPEPNGIRKPDK